MERKYYDKMKTSVVFTHNEDFPLSRECLAIKLPDGSIFLTWTSGGFSEPLDGNMTMYSQSYDNGETWTAAKVLFEHPYKGVFTTALFVDDGVLYAYLNSYTSRAQLYQDMQSYISKSYDNGKTFTVPFSIPGGANGVHIKQAFKSSNGRWIMPFSWCELTGEEWAAPTLGNPINNAIIAGEKAKHTVIPTSYDGMRAHMKNNAWGYNNHYQYVGVLISDDKGESYRMSGKLGGEVRWSWEPAIVQLSDGTLVIYYRAQHDGFTWESRSYDNGETWTKAVRTDIPNPSTKVRLYKDKKGYIYLIHNPDSKIRNPLSLWVSMDDMKTWEIKIDLVNSPGMNINYPDGYIDNETDELCFSWEDQRDVYFSKIKLEDIK